MGRACSVTAHYPSLKTCVWPHDGGHLPGGCASLRWYLCETLREHEVLGWTTAGRQSGLGAEGNGMDHIPVSSPSIEAEDIRAVTETMRAGWISSEGPQVQEFEQKFAALVATGNA